MIPDAPAKPSEEDLPRDLSLGENFRGRSSVQLPTVPDRVWRRENGNTKNMRKMGRSTEKKGIESSNLLEGC